MQLFGDRLKLERKRLQLTQDQAAEFAKVSRIVWGKYERNSVEPSVSIIMNFAATGADICYLLTGNRAEKAMDAHESILVTAWRAADASARNAALLALLGGAPKVASTINQVGVKNIVKNG